MTPEESIKALQAALDKSRSFTFFGGAGVSTESGIPDFRSVDGLYHQKFAYPPEQILSHTFFCRKTSEFYDFYRQKLLYNEKVIKPNPAHIRLAEYEAIGKLRGIVTQNIDGLHQAAGANKVYELHGSIHRNFCTGCGKFFPMSYIKESEGIPRCPDCGGLIKPDVVLYEEGLNEETVQGAIRAISEADTLIIGGTSLAVYPAAGLIRYFRGDRLILVNRDATPADGEASLIIREPIGKVFGALVVR